MNEFHIRISIPADAGDNFNLSQLFGPDGALSNTNWSQDFEVISVNGETQSDDYSPQSGDEIEIVPKEGKLRKRLSSY